MRGAMFLVKKLIKPFFLPPMIVILTITYGVLCVHLKKRRGKYFILAGIAVFYLLSISPVTNVIIKPLESRFHPVDKVGRNDPSTIVVLAGGVRVNHVYPITSALKCSSTARVLEAYRIYKMLKSPEVIIVGGSGDPLIDFKESKKMRDLILMLGVSRENVTIELQSRDTYENMDAVKKKLKSKPFWLVTSALHMPRAMFLARKLGLNAWPAPCDSHYNEVTGLTSFIPDPYNFFVCTAATNEYLGITWYKLAWRLGIR